MFHKLAVGIYFVTSIKLYAFYIVINVSNFQLKDTYLKLIYIDTCSIYHKKSIIIYRLCYKKKKNAMNKVLKKKSL